MQVAKVNAGGEEKHAWNSTKFVEFNSGLIIMQQLLKVNFKQVAIVTCRYIQGIKLAFKINTCN